MRSEAVQKIANAGAVVAGKALSHAIHKQFEKALEGSDDDSKSESEDGDSESKEEEAVQRTHGEKNNESNSNYEDSYVVFSRENL